MIGLAREHASRRAAANITFCTDREFEQRSKTFDFISCYLVLQRLREAEGLELVRRLVSALAPGGVALFLVPYADKASPVTRALRAVRRRIVPANALVNLLRGRPTGEPFAPHIYELSRVLEAVQGETSTSTNALLEPQQGLDAALLFVEAPMPRRRTRTSTIDVNAVITETSIEALNRSAEEYFSTLDGWEHHLAKPFATIEEAPRLLGGVAALLQGLDLRPGARVLEFGAGTGWLSRSLSQLGCRAVLLDVSQTALDMARETYARLPVIGPHPEPEFLLFDGRRVDLPDASVDRIVCFHAFHHVPNPDEVIRECARVLAPGGIAGFAEPGPRHSRSSFSQFEMQTYKVVENDVDVHAIWRAAQAAGFSDIKLAIFHGPAFHVPLVEFEDFLAGGPSTDRWAAATRIFLRGMRTFFLIKSGSGAIDSRSADALGCEIHAALVEPARQGQAIVVAVRLTNTGRGVWLPSDATPGGVRVGAHLYDHTGTLLAFDLPTAPVAVPARAIVPRELVQCRLDVPPQTAGRYTLEIDCVSAGISWFAPLGSKPFRLAVDVN
jgi:SAM-dependent methyltransferase